MILEVNGTAYTYFTSASVEVRLDALCRVFRFTTSRTGSKVLPFRGGEAVRVLTGDNVLVTGYIEQVNADYDAASHSITISGRSKVGDLLDSSLSSAGDFKPPISLKRVAQLVISQLGLNFQVIDNVAPDLFDKASDQVAPEPGQNAFEFLEALARKRQVLVTSDEMSNLVLTRSGTRRSPGALQNLLGADDNNVITASVSYDLSGRYRDYKFVSGANPLALAFAGVTDVDTVANQKGQALDTAIRVGRQLALVPESPLSDADNKVRAQWEADVRKARSRVYSAVVQGFRPSADAAPWEVNTVVDVADDFAGINGAMLINSATYNYDEDQGRTTTLGMVATNSYTLQLTEPKTEKVGFGFLPD